MSIPLPQIFPISEPDQYKAHLATKNESGHRPLDVFVRDRSEWGKWNAWRSHRDEFNRPRIFALIDFYPESDIWLFGGVYNVLSRSEEDHAHSYKVERSVIGNEYVGRLKIQFERPGRIRAIKLNRYIDQMEVSELLRRTYSGERFSGYESICHDFSQLETIFQTEKKDWKAALQSVKGVYLITDKNNGKSYVGAAYGEHGIWSRWKNYLNTGHGWNDELTRIIDEKGIDYARENFQFTLLEYMPARTDDSTIIERESFWKRALLSQTSDFGYNRN